MSVIRLRNNHIFSANIGTFMLPNNVAAQNPLAADYITCNRLWLFGRS